MSDQPLGAACSNPCPECGSNMFLRDGSKGRFYGCDKYPDCKGSLDLSNASIKYPNEPAVTDPEMSRRLLESFCLGIALASKKHRKELNAEDFSHIEYEQAFSSILNGKADYALFARLIEWEYGILWQKKDGNPIDAAFKRLKLISKQSRLIQAVTEAIRASEDNVSDSGIERFLDAIRESVKKIDE